MSESRISGKRRASARLHKEPRTQGPKQAQFEVPDVATRSIARAAQGQSRAVAASKFAKADQGFIDSISLAIDE